MKKLVVLLVISTLSCSPEIPTAQEVIDEALRFSKVERLKNAEASFTFRGTEYEYQLRNGNFRYTRSKKDTLGNTLRDVLINSGFNRFVNDSLIIVPEKKKAAYEASVNSVIYFAFLPLSLNDGAVIKAYVGLVEVNEKNYHKIKVTFKEEGGGEDFDDVFFYWFDGEDYSLDYLAYSYAENDGTGMRFREAYNQRKINGVIMQDYRNFKPKEKEAMKLEEMDKAFQEGELELLSVIELEDIQINF